MSNVLYAQLLQFTESVITCLELHSDVSETGMCETLLNIVLRRRRAAATAITTSTKDTLLSVPHLHELYTVFVDKSSFCTGCWQVRYGSPEWIHQVRETENELTYVRLNEGKKRPRKGYEEIAGDEIQTAEA